MFDHHVTDYVVVGAGSAGSVVVRRLLDAGHTVHLLEAGPTDTAPAIHSKQGWPTLIGGPLDWGMFTTPQRHANNRRIYWPRGKVLGGSSSLNGLIYIRGHAGDYDDWAATSGDPGWAWANVLPLFKRSEAHAAGASEYHGGDGPLPVSVIDDPHPLSRGFVNAAAACGHKLIDDFNSADKVGVGYNDITAQGGERMSTWKSFVGPVLGHPNLTVTTDPIVHKVVVQNHRAVAVEYSHGPAGVRLARAEAEVVLSAGTLGSPKILMLSGIGPSQHLRSVGVSTVVDLPGVGENLHDHLLLSNRYEADEQISPGSNNLLESQLFAHSADTDDVAPDLQPVFLHIPYRTDGDPAPEHGYTIAAGLVAPKSRGTLRLLSSDPADPVLADPNILAAPCDLEAMVDALEMSREIGASVSFAQWRKSEVAPGPAAICREQSRAFVRQAVGTYHHQVGTCKMGAADDPEAVVASDFRVHGLDGLRVADASIMPTVTRGNTNAPAIMIGERASDLMLA